MEFLNFSTVYAVSVISAMGMHNGQLVCNLKTCTKCATFLQLEVRGKKLEIIILK